MPRTSSISSTPHLRIAVIGTQTAAPESPKPYTVYRTVVTFDGECYERLIRFSEFYTFNKTHLKLRNSKPFKAEFPGKTWTRKAALEDDLIEARQVMLNEFMKELCTKELTPRSETYLLKLLKIGKYDDGSGRVSEMSSSSHMKASFHVKKNERGVLDVLHESSGDSDTLNANETGGQKTKQKKQKHGRRGSSPPVVGEAATLVVTESSFPMVTSNATTVLTDDEQSMVGSQSRITSDGDNNEEQEEEERMLQEQDVIAADARATATATAAAAAAAKTRAPLHKSTSIPPSPYSEMILKRPALKASQSLPGSRRGSKRVAFPTQEAESDASTSSLHTTATTATATATENGDVVLESMATDSGSPETKYKERISNQLQSIRRLLSESEPDMTTSRSSISNSTENSVPASVRSTHSTMAVLA